MSRLSCLQCVAKGNMMVLLHYIMLSHVRKLDVCVTACEGCLALRNLYRSSSSTRIDLKISWCCFRHHDAGQSSHGCKRQPDLPASCFPCTR